MKKKTIGNLAKVFIGEVGRKFYLYYISTLLSN